MTCSPTHPRCRRCAATIDGYRFGTGETDGIHVHLPDAPENDEWIAEDDPDWRFKL